MMAQEGGGTSTHVDADPHDDDGETLAAFIARRRGKTAVSEYSKETKDDNVWCFYSLFSA